MTILWALFLLSNISLWDRIRLVLVGIYNITRAQHSVFIADADARYLRV